MRTARRAMPGNAFPETGLSPTDSDGAEREVLLVHVQTHLPHSPPLGMLRPCEREARERGRRRRGGGRRAGGVLAEVEPPRTCKSLRCQHCVHSQMRLRRRADFCGSGDMITAGCERMWQELHGSGWAEAIGWLMDVPGGASDKPGAKVCAMLPRTVAGRLAATAEPTRPPLIIATSANGVAHRCEICRACESAAYWAMCAHLWLLSMAQNNTDEA